MLNGSENAEASCWLNWAEIARLGRHSHNSDRNARVCSCELIESIALTFSIENLILQTSDIRIWCLWVDRIFDDDDD